MGWRIEREFGGPVRVVGDLGGEVCTIASGGYGRKEVDAATIISASREMLDALYGILNIEPTGCGDGPGFDNSEVFMPSGLNIKVHFERVRAAIKKADPDFRMFGC